MDKLQSIVTTKSEIQAKSHGITTWLAPLALMLIGAPRAFLHEAILTGQQMFYKKSWFCQIKTFNTRDISLYYSSQKWYILDAENTKKA